MRASRWAAVMGAGLIIGVPLSAHAAVSGSAPPAPVNPSATISSVRAAVGQALRPAAAPTAAPAQTRSAADTSSSSESTDAPAGTAESYAARLGNILGISHTSVSASGTGTSSTANPLEINGQPLSSQFGGSQTGPGSSSGALIDTGPSNQFRLAIAPWSVSNTQSSDQSSASAESAILGLDLGDPTTAQSASVRLLQSQSGATWTPTASSSSSSSDGAIIGLGGPGGLNLDLLHSGTGSTGSGSYLASVNGTQIGSSSQANGSCSLSLPSLLSLDCLTNTSGGSGGLTSQASSVLTAVLGSGANSLGIGALTSTSSFGAGATSPGGGGGGGSGGGGGGSGSGSPAPTPQLGSAHSASAPIAAVSAASTPASGKLAFTGLNVWALVALALLLGVTGSTAVVAARRRLAPTS